jgi:hypothetical protein
MSLRFSLSMLLVAALLALVANGAWAQDGRGRGHDRGRGGQDSGMRARNDRARSDAMQRPMMVEPRQQRPRRDDGGMGESVRRVERSSGGRVISAERIQSDGRDLNRIKVMDDRGRVRVYMDDPQQRRGAPTRDDDN